MVTLIITTPLFQLTQYGRLLASFIYQNSDVALFNIYKNPNTGVEKYYIVFDSLLTSYKLIALLSECGIQYDIEVKQASINI